MSGGTFEFPDGRRDAADRFAAAEPPVAPGAMVVVDETQRGRVEDLGRCLLLFVLFLYRDKLATLASQFLSHSFENCEKWKKKFKQEDSLTQYPIFLCYQPGGKRQRFDRLLPHRSDGSRFFYQATPR